MESLVLLTALTTAHSCIMEERILDGCLERIIPRQQWAEAVTLEIAASNVTDCEVFSRLMRHRNVWVRESLRSHLAGYQWTWENQLWLCSHGECGEAPKPWMRMNLGEFVRNVGKKLPAMVRDQ